MKHSKKDQTNLVSQDICIKMLKAGSKLHFTCAFTNPSATMFPLADTVSLSETVVQWGETPLHALY